MKSKNCVLKTELMEGLLQHERDTNIPPISLIESLVEDFLFKRGYLVISNPEEFVEFPTELNQPHIKYTYVTKEGKLQIQKSINKKTYVYGTCEYDKANEIISFLKRKNWDIKYSTNQTKLKAGKQIEFLLNEIEKESNLMGAE